jgi:hypothetical protein
MQRARVVIKPQYEMARLLLMHEGKDLVRATLPLRPQNSRAVRLVLEGLAQWLGVPLSVVLYVDGLGNSCGLDLCDALGFGVETLHFEVDVVDRRNLGLGSFRDLREIAERQEGGK